MANSFSTIPAYTIAWLYAAAFGRTPVPSATAGKGDNNGLDYWTNQYLGGTGAQTAFVNNVYAIADFFVTSPEFLAKYPTAMTSGDFVTALYKNQLGRTPDLAGYNYWVGRLDSGQTRGQVLADFSNAPENQNANTLRKDAINNYIIFLANDADHIISDAEAAIWLAANPTFDAAKVDATGSTGGQTFTLTDKVDVIPGLIGSNGTTSTAGDDTIIAGEGSSATTHTLGSSDVINAGEGIDRMNLRLADTAVPGTGQTVTPNMTSVEKVFTQALASGAGVNTINAINVTGTKEWWSENSTTTLIVNNVKEAAAVGVIGGDVEAAEIDDYLVGFQTSAVTGTLAVVLQGATLDDLGVSAQDGVAEFATWDINVTGTANSSIDTLTDNLQNPVAGLTTINVSGDKQLTIDDVLTGVTTFNASKQTAGGLRVLVDPGKDITFTGGAGADRVDVGAAGLDLNDKLDGGAGTADTFRISNGVMLTSALAGNVKGFEIFEGRGIGQTYDMDALVANNTLTEIRLNPTSGVGNNITVNNIPSTATAIIRAVADEIGTATLTAKNFIQGGTTDTATLILDNGIAVGTGKGYATGIDIATLDFARVDNLNINSVSDGTPAVGEENSIAALTAGDLEVVTITGDNGIVLTTTATSNAVTKVDASGLASATTGLTLLTLNLSADTAGEGAEIIGTAQKDVITSTAVNIAGKGDNITAGAGSDTVNLSTTALARNNTLNYTAATIATGDLASDTQDTVTNIAVGDRINMTAGVEAQLKVNGLTLSATAANQTLTAAAFDINNNIIAVDKGADRAIQIDLNGDGLFTSTLDFEILLAGRAGSTVVYDATNDYFNITALGGGGGGGGAVASNTLTVGVDTFNNTTVVPTATFGGVDYKASYTQNGVVTLFSSAANLQATDNLTFGTGAATLQMQGAVNSATFVSAANTIGTATITGLDNLLLDNVINNLTVSGDYGSKLAITGGAQQDVINVNNDTTGGLTVNAGEGPDLITVAAGVTPAAGNPVIVNTGNGDNTVTFGAVGDLNLAVGAGVTVAGGTGTDTLVLSAAGDDFTDATFLNVTNFEVAKITGGANGNVTLGINAFGAGIRTIDVNGASTITTTYAALAPVTVVGTNVADGTTLTFGAGTNGTVNVTDFKGDIAAAATVTANLSVGVSAAATTAVAINQANHTGTLTLTGGTAGQDATITGDANSSNTITATTYIGTLTVTYTDLTSNAATLNAGTGNVTVTDGGATDTVTVNGLNTNNQTFTEGGAGAGKFVINAGAGNQTITVLAAGADSITGGAGNDTIDLTATGAIDHVIFAGGTGTAGTVARVGSLGVDTISNFGGQADLLDFKLADFGVAAGAVNTDQISLIANTATAVATDSSQNYGAGTFSYSAAGFFVVGTGAAASTNAIYYYDGSKTNAASTRTVAELVADGDAVLIANVGVITNALNGTEFAWIA